MVKSGYIPSKIMIYFLHSFLEEPAAAPGAAVHAPHYFPGLHGVMPAAWQKRTSLLKYSYSLSSMILYSY